jgi:hypothetical protein
LDEVTREWRKLHNEELHNLFSSPNITRMIKSRRMRLVGHVARMREIRTAYKFWLESLIERDRFEDLGIGERIILK